MRSTGVVTCPHVSGTRGQDKECHDLHPIGRCYCSDCAGLGKGKEEDDLVAAELGLRSANDFSEVQEKYKDKIKEALGEVGVLAKLPLFRSPKAYNWQFQPVRIQYSLLNGLLAKSNAVQAHF